MATFHRFKGTSSQYDWDSIREIRYLDELAKGVLGRILIGRDDGAQYFVFRYFRVEPGGHTNLNDKHPHDHGVMILHGQALVNIGSDEYLLAPMDIVHIPPWESHSFSAAGDEPLGFLCVIPNKDLLEASSQDEGNSFT